MAVICGDPAAMSGALGVRDQRAGGPVKSNDVYKWILPGIWWRFHTTNHPGDRIVNRRLLCLPLLLMLVVPARSAIPRQLHHFDMLMDALQDGAAVRVVVDYDLCRRLSSGSATVATAAVSGLTVDLWEYVPNGVEGNDRAYVVISHAALMVHPHRGLVTNLVTITVDEDVEVTITIRHLEPGTAKEIALEKFGTTIAHGVEGGASFYRLD